MSQVAHGLINRALVQVVERLGCEGRVRLVGGKRAVHHSGSLAELPRDVQVASNEIIERLDRVVRLSASARGMALGRSLLGKCGYALEEQAEVIERQLPRRSLVSDIFVQNSQCDWLDITSSVFDISCNWRSMREVLAFRKEIADFEVGIDPLLEAPECLQNQFGPKCQG